MGERQAVADDGSRCVLLVSLFLLSASLAIAAHRPAQAQTEPAGCEPAIARLVALQGVVEIQRSEGEAWVRVARLDTALCPGDRLRTGAVSRAGLHVVPETIVRVDQNTVITLNHSAEEIAVEFFVAELAARAANANSCGAGYFITRFPKTFKVRTPHMNAAVEGTEFMVETSCDATRLTVLEGKVSSESAATGGRKLVEAGQSIASGAAGAGAIATVVRPADAVQWALRFPPISDQTQSGGIASAAQCAARGDADEAACLTVRAEALLRSGSVGDALSTIDAALAADNSDSDAHALRSIVQVAKNDESDALESAKRAVAAGADNVRAWLALSYAQQAGFDLEAALSSVERAQALEPGSSLVNARAAELLLSLGDSRRAGDAARAAVASNPAESHAHSILGFVHLSQADIQAAQAAFSAAVERDSFSSLPRFGLGLVMIRKGNLVAGREQIEIAVALDPSNSLLRSYLGKTYYEENTKARDALANEQFEFARELDPNDPTPWFYAAILQDSQHKPGPALASLEKSAELNDGRATYRSRQLLDQDLAARGASQASVFNELGFHRLGLVEASFSLGADPVSSSAHRFLADIYATLPRHEIARASELLQSQLRQPLGAPSLQAQLANDVLFQGSFFGPATVGLNEFNPLYVRDGLRTQVFGVLGNNDTLGGQALLNGLQGPVSFALSMLESETDGYRTNNDDSFSQQAGFIQWQMSGDASLQAEFSDSSRESGDLTSAFDPAFISEVIRSEEDVKTQRLGYRHAIDARSDFIVSVIRQDRHAVLDIPDPLFPATVITDQDSWKAEAQYHVSRDAFNLVFGGGYFDGDSSEELIFPPISLPMQFEPRHTSAYGYVVLPHRTKLPQIQLGVSYDDLTSEVGQQSEFNPKFGLTWNVTGSTTLRAAAFRTLKRRINSDQGLEPTQVAGFNQIFDDQNGTVSEGGGLAIDHRVSPEVALGLEVTRRNLTVPYFDLDVFFRSQREDVVSGYLYWLPRDNLSVAIDPRFHDFKRGALFERMELLELPISAKYFAPSGVWLGVNVTGVEQDGEFTGPGGIDARGTDTFWVVDAVVAYRWPRRRGTISVEGTNLFDEAFRFQEIDQSVTPRYAPERQLRLRFSISF